MISRRCILLATPGLGPPAWAQTSALTHEGIQALGAGGAIMLMRHSDTPPGSGDPLGFRLGDCSTQRNLSPQGRAQAIQLGAALTAAGVRFVQVQSSQWCRCIDTAQIMFGARPEEWPALNSFLEDRKMEAPRMTELRARVRAWRGPGNLALITHRPTVVALSGFSPAAGQAVVLAPDTSATGFAVHALN